MSSARTQSTSNRGTNLVVELTESLSESSAKTMVVDATSSTLTSVKSARPSRRMARTTEGRPMAHATWSAVTRSSSFLSGITSCFSCSPVPVFKTRAVHCGKSSIVYEKYLNEWWPNLLSSRRFAAAPTRRPRGASGKQRAPALGPYESASGFFA